MERGRKSLQKGAVGLPGGDELCGCDGEMGVGCFVGGC